MTTIIDNDIAVEQPQPSSAPCLASTRDEVKVGVCQNLVLSVVVLGASGDLAKKKTFPALYTLWDRGFLPDTLRIVGYARSKLSDEDLRAKLKGYLKGDNTKLQKFLELITYVQGSYDAAEGFQALHKALKQREGELPKCPVGRLYYLALPPSVYAVVIKGLKENATELPPNSQSWLRLVVEKPFGKDLESSEELANELGRYFPEEQIYRIDHYLGKELAQNLIVLRFANSFIGPLWNRNYISNVQICFKEPFGTAGRGGYFDEFGIIRDVIQNHLMQVMSLLCMEKPISLNADDIRDEKVKVLRSCLPVRVEDTVLGQYTAANGEAGYLDDPGVPKTSRTPTFALCAIHIQNDRWQGVPFLLKAGKALNERKVEIRVQFKPPSQFLGPHKDLDVLRNELVLRLQPDEAIYMKLAVKKPGLGMETIMSEMDLTYKDRYANAFIPEAYERLILDAVRGDQQHFVRRDELRAAWAIFTPLLHSIDQGELMPLAYAAGTRGPPEADVLVAKNGFVRTDSYTWTEKPKKVAASL